MIRIILVLIIYGLMFCGCLKTRSQIKSDETQEVAVEKQNKSQRYEMEEMKNEITRLSGKVDSVEHSQHNQNFSDTKEKVIKLDTRMTELEKNQLLIFSELKELKDQRTTTTKSPSTSVKEIFVEANQDLQDKNYTAASSKYEEIINKGVKNKDAAEAHFGLGEAEYGQKHYKKAIVEYSKVQEAYSKSLRVPTSLYRIGVCFEYLNMKKEAQGFYNELIERYPKSSESKRAKSRLKKE